MNVRYGIIGLGRISTRFAKALKMVDGATLTSVAAREQSRADEFALQFGANSAYASYLDLIKNPEVDIVYIGLTNQLHYEIIKLCLENHKAVLCEKPLVTTRNESEELVNLAEKNQTLLMEAMWTRCMPAFQKAREWVTTGRVGQVKLITANFCYRKEYDPDNRQYNPKLGGGSLFDVGIYPIQFAAGILGEYPQTVSGEAKISPSGVDELDSITLNFKSGALAALTCGFNVSAKDEAVIYGTSGHIILENCYGPKKGELYNEEGLSIEQFHEDVADGFVYQIRHCADLFRQGKLESDLIPWGDTIACTDIFDLLMTQWGLKKL